VATSFLFKIETTFYNIERNNNIKMSFKVYNTVELTEDCADVPKCSKGIILKILKDSGIVQGLHVEFRIDGKKGTFPMRVPLSVIRIVS
jgi:hypothetical protein